jgi:GTPase SAR1 family protein
MNHETPVKQVAEKATVIEKQLEKIAPYHDLIEHEQNELARCLEEFRRDATAAGEENRKLRIGIIGQVKAGKSSLLNALLFDGNDVLPKAATPMTAALTVIKHDTKTWAEVEFYSEDDWKKITQASETYWERYRTAEQELRAELASRWNPAASAEPAHADVIRRSGITDELKIAKELVESATPEVTRKIGTPNLRIDEVADPTELTARLQEYIGAQGTYTPIVKSSVIYYNHEHLQDLEIIDTPGLNDPVLSRGARTREYMGQCDVVFLLMQCGRFADETDMQLLLCNIPSKGIKDVLIIGSHFDASLSGEAARYDSIKQLVINLAHGYREELMNLLNERLGNCRNDHQKEIFSRLIANCTKQEGSDKVISPVFISAMAYKAAKHFDTPDKSEQLCINSLNDLYPDFSVNREILEQLSNIERINVALMQQKERKNEILQGRLAEILKQIEPRFATLQGNIVSAVDNKIEKLGKIELTDILDKEKKIATRINKGRSGVEDAFDTSICGIKTGLISLVMDTKSLSREFTKLRERTETKTEEYEVSIPRRFLGFDVSWIAGHHTETRSRIVSKRYADAQDAIEEVKDFAQQVECKLVNDMKEIINIGQLQNDILKAAEHFVDKDDDSGRMDLEEDIIKPVERAVRNISIPRVDFGDAGRYVTPITAKFSGRVEEGSFDSLRKAKSAAIEAVIKDLDTMLKVKINVIEEYLQKSRDEFVTTLVKDIQSELDKYRDMLKDKQGALKRLEELKEVLSSI